LLPVLVTAMAIAIGSVLIIVLANAVGAAGIALVLAGPREWVAVL
jgi:hypothetical protein